MDVVVIILHENRNGLPIGSVVAITPADLRMRTNPSCRAPGQSALVLTDVPDDVNLAAMRERFISPLFNENTGEVLAPRAVLLEWGVMTEQTRNALSKTSRNHAAKVPWSVASEAKVFDHIWNLQRTIGELVERTS